MTDNDDTEAAQLATFVTAIRAFLGDRAAEHRYTEVDGFRWSWTHRGLWKLSAGSLLRPGVQLSGPLCRLSASPASLRQADLVAVILQLCEAFPPAVTAAAGATYGAPIGGGPVAMPVPAQMPSPWSTPPTGVPQLPSRHAEAAVLGRAGMGPGAAYAPQPVRVQQPPRRPRPHGRVDQGDTVG